MKATSCEVHVFDPTLSPEAKARVQALPRTYFHDYGLAGTEGVIAPQSTLTMGRAVGAFTVKRLSTIMQVCRPLPLTLTEACGDGKLGFHLHLICICIHISISIAWSLHQRAEAAFQRAESAFQRAESAFRRAESAF